MKITNIDTYIDSDYYGWQADIEYENCNKGKNTYYIYVKNENKEFLSKEAADAFFISGIIPALSNNEERIYIERPICPLLKDNANEIIFWIKHWNQDKYQKKTNNLFLNAKTREDVIESKNTESSLFLSGGLDSIFSLQHNVSNVPYSHPARIKYAITVFGFDIGGRIKDNSTESLACFNLLTKKCLDICEPRNIQHIPVYTNIRHLDDTPGFWGNEFVGCALSAIALALNGKSNYYFLSSDGAPFHLTPNNYFPPPFGDHAILTPATSSYETLIRFYLTHINSRLERLERVSREIDLLNSLRVCYRHQPDRLNCGKCEKCLRTMLELYVLDRLCDCETLPSDININDLEKITISSNVGKLSFIELSQAIKPKNLVIYTRLQKIISDYNKYESWKNKTNFSGRIKKFDDKYLNRMIQKITFRI